MQTEELLWSILLTFFTDLSGSIAISGMLALTINVNRFKMRLEDLQNDCLGIDFFLQIPNKFLSNLHCNFDQSVINKENKLIHVYNLAYSKLTSHIIIKQSSYSVSCDHKVKCSSSYLFNAFLNCKNKEKYLLIARKAV